MKDKIVDIEGKKFLMNFSDNSFLEVADYNEPKINTLTPFSYIDTGETSERYFGDINYSKENKKWGCINGRNEVVIPCIYDNIDIGDNIFTGVKGLKRFDFDAEGVPIYKYRINGIEKTTRFIGWQYVERFDDKPISIGAKNGKIGIVKIDGSPFLPPEYDSICIDWSKKCITTEKAGVTTQILYFEQKKCWSPIPSEFSFYKEQLDLYILKRNGLFAGMDKAGNFVIAPSFSSLEIFRNVIIGTYNGKKGALSRTETITSSFYAPILPFVYDDIKTRTNDYNNLIKQIDEINEKASEKYKSKNAIPNLLNRIMFCIPEEAQLTSLKNTEGSHIVITARSKKIEQLGYFLAQLKAKEYLLNITTTSGNKSGEYINITIEGDLP